MPAAWLVCQPPSDPPPIQTPFGTASCFPNTCPPSPTLSPVLLLLRGRHSQRRSSTANCDTPQYWRWIDDFPEARFPEVAELRMVCWFEIRGKIDTSLLSTMTTYVAYLVFKPTYNFSGFQNNPVEVAVGLAGGNVQNRTVYFDRRQQNIVPGDNPGLFPKERGDGWLESELGEFFHGSDEEGKLLMTILVIKGGNRKHGLVVQGIEIRPKKGYI